MVLFELYGSNDAKGHYTSSIVYFLSVIIIRIFLARILVIEKKGKLSVFFFIFVFLAFLFRQKRNASNYSFLIYEHQRSNCRVEIITGYTKLFNWTYLVVYSSRIIIIIIVCSATQFPTFNRWQAKGKRLLLINVIIKL